MIPQVCNGRDSIFGAMRCLFQSRAGLLSIRKVQGRSIFDKIIINLEGTGYDMVGLFWDRVAC